MSASTTSALHALLPSYTNPPKPVPTLLTSTAESLLALSRQRARNLKPDEEIARAHACAEIACSRLRAQLRLPVVKSGAGAPCQPRVYAKLVRFLEGVLGDVSAAGGGGGGGGAVTPRGKKRDAKGEVVNEKTPTKRQSGVEAGRKDARKSETGFVGVVKTARRKNGDMDADQAPSFVMPSIRALCKALQTPSLAPHVYTGICTILPLTEIWSSDYETEITSELKADILALITALYLMVLTRMQTEEMTTEVYDEVTGKAVEVLEMDADGDGAALEKVEEWIGRLNERGWCDGMEWWSSVPEGVLEFGVDGEQGVEAERVMKQMDKRKDRAEKMAVGEDDPEGVLLPGLGTMLHEGIDWTSAERCLDYREWKDGVMRMLDTPVKAIGKGRSVAVK